ncbi:hypothetical protein GCM10009836_45590 [Pseudonocardia ailaonensis]|uniref:DUF5615 domain-containing protein n=1 Tax=Pseudonocardia ailaonensis TaxID=367279 RepID=A0ABN2NDK3_9PSEU
MTVYAHEQGAVLLTHDKEFSQRRKRNVIGRHVWLRCLDLDAPALVERRLDEIVAAVSIREDIWVRVSQDGMDTSFAWE